MIESTAGKPVDRYISTVDGATVGLISTSLDDFHFTIIPTIDHLCEQKIILGDGKTVRLAWAGENTPGESIHTLITPHTA